MLTLEIKKQIKDYALKSNNEICGLLLMTGQSYSIFPCKNVAFNKENQSIVSAYDYLRADEVGKIVGCYHSQKSDQISIMDNFTAFSQNLYSIVYCKKSDKFYTIDPVLKNYLNKDFNIESANCFTLIRDYYQEELNIKLNNHFIQENWYNKTPNIINDNIGPDGFYEVNKDEMKKNDILLFNDKKGNISHLAIFLGNGNMIHHPRNHKSVIEYLDKHYLNRLEKVIRYKNE